MKYIAKSDILDSYEYKFLDPNAPEWFHSLLESYDHYHEDTNTRSLLMFNKYGKNIELFEGDLVVCNTTTGDFTIIHTDEEWEELDEHFIALPDNAITEEAEEVLEEIAEDIAEEIRALIIEARAAGVPASKLIKAMEGAM